MDDITVAWSEDRYNEIISKIRPFLKLIGFNLDDGEVTFMPISGFTGANLLNPPNPSDCSWYNGPTLLHHLNQMSLPERKSESFLLMPVSGKYRDMGVIVTGKIESGQVRKGQTILVMPNRHMAEILGISIEESDVQFASAGDNVRLKLKGIEEEEVSTGFVLCDPSRPVKSGTIFTAQIALQNIKNIVAPGYKAVLHIHTCSEEATIIGFEAIYDKKTKEKMPMKARFAKQGDVVEARIECQGIVCMESVSDCDSLGRFTLRDEGKTIAVGRVLKVENNSE